MRKKLIHIIEESGKRFFAPVGCRDMDPDTIDDLSIPDSEKYTKNLLHPVEMYDYDFVQLTIPLEDARKIIDLHGQNIYESKLVKDHIEALVSSSKRTKKIVAPGSFGPFSLATQFYEIEDLCRMARKNPLELHKIIKRMNSFVENYIKICKDHGLRFFWLGEPMGAILSPSAFQEFCGDYIKGHFEDEEMTGFLHIPGKTDHILDGMIETGAQCLSIDSNYDMRSLLQRVPHDVVIMGNINSISLLLEDCDSIEKLTIDLNEKIKNFSNVIVSSGGGISDETPKDNIEIMKKVTDAYPLLWNKEELKTINDGVKMGIANMQNNVPLKKSGSNALDRAIISELEYYANHNR